MLKIALRPALTPEDIDRILDIAEEAWIRNFASEEDEKLEALEIPKTVH